MFFLKRSKAAPIGVIIIASVLSLYFYLTRAEGDSPNFDSSFRVVGSDNAKVNNSPEQGVFDSLNSSMLFSDGATLMSGSYLVGVTLVDKDSGSESHSFGADVKYKLVAEKDSSEKNLIYFKIQDPIASVRDGDFEMSRDEKAEYFLEKPFAVKYSEDGLIAKVLLSEDEIEFSASVKRSIVSRLQIFAPASNDPYWKKLENDEIGVALTEYKREGVSEVSKSILEYKRSDVGMDGRIKNVFGSTSYALKPNMVLNSLVYNQSTIVVMPRVSLMGEMEASVLIESLGEYSGGSIAFNYSDKYLELPLYASGMFGYPDAPSEAQLLGSLDAIDVEEFLEQTQLLEDVGDIHGLWGVRDRLYSSISTDPSILNELIQNFTDGVMSEMQESLLLGVLVDLQTAEAQSALIDLAGNPSLDVSAREHILSHFSMLTEPTNAAVEYLESVAFDDQSGHDARLRSVAVLGLGAAVRSLVNSGTGYSDDSSAHVASRILEGYKGASATEKRAYLLAMGNAGHENFKAVLSEYATSENPADRAMAIDSLRFNSDPEVDSMVVGFMLGDSDSEVRIAAVQTSAYRPENAAIDNALQHYASGAEDVEHKLMAYNALESRIGNREEFMGLMEEVYSTSEDQRLKEYAKDFIQSNRSESELGKTHGPDDEQDIKQDLQVLEAFRNDPQPTPESY